MIINLENMDRENTYSNTVSDIHERWDIDADAPGNEWLSKYIKEKVAENISDADVIHFANSLLGRINKIRTEDYTFD